MILRIRHENEKYVVAAKKRKNVEWIIGDGMSVAEALGQFVINNWFELNSSAACFLWDQGDDETWRHLKKSGFKGTKRYSHLDHDCYPSGDLNKIFFQDLPASVRLINLLDRIGVLHLSLTDGVRALSLDKLKNCSGWGEKTIGELKSILKNYDLSLQP